MESTPMPLLEVNNIEVVYHDIIQVLRGVSLSVAEGSIVSLLGTNGAGKTTTLRAISGLLKPENGFIKDGHIRFRGVDVTNRLGTEVVRHGAVMVPEGRRVFKHLTVDENIRVRVHHPQGRRGRRAAGHEAHVRALPAPVARDEPAGRVLLGRRAADDRHRPRADGGPAHADAGRALARSRAAAGDGDLRPASGTSTGS